MSFGVEGLDIEGFDRRVMVFHVSADSLTGFTVHGTCEFGHLVAYGVDPALGEQNAATALGL